MGFKGFIYDHDILVNNCDECYYKGNCDLVNVLEDDNEVCDSYEYFDFNNLELRALWDTKHSCERYLYDYELCMYIDGDLLLFECVKEGYKYRHFVDENTGRKLTIDIKKYENRLNEVERKMNERNK